MHHKSIEPKDMNSACGQSHINHDIVYFDALDVSV